MSKNSPTDKYDVPQLKEDSAAFAEKKLNVKNVAKTVVISHMHGAKDLFDATLTFIVSNMEVVYQSEE